LVSIQHHFVVVQAHRPPLYPLRSSGEWLYAIPNPRSSASNPPSLTDGGSVWRGALPRPGISGMQAAPRKRGSGASLRIAPLDSILLQSSGYDNARSTMGSAFTHADGGQECQKGNGGCVFRQANRRSSRPPSSAASGPSRENASPLSLL
jgi:hypothetical protein